MQLTFTFTLTFKDVNGTTATDTVKVVSDPGAVGVDSAFYKRGDLQWRVRGTAKYCAGRHHLAHAGSGCVLLGGPGEGRGHDSAAHRRRTITVRSAYGGGAANVPFQIL